MISLFQKSDFILPHISGLSEGNFPVVLGNSLDSLHNTACVHPLFFPLPPGKSTFNLNPISIPIPCSPENAPFKLQGRVHNTPLVISYRQAWSPVHGPRTH
ncbi:hypothetical protein TNCV_4876571 [Trichonephila clavipes]|uniref:Uncharacterized protein n=1 Tax=Trichonephila clavipes TaxID=2585209 RepID=A0A8X6REX1_TRICX|nr:hypothetical protein TNCV_4876571 [Trichonephila clavipes]